MENVELAYTVENFNAVAKQYERAINKFTYRLYRKYKLIIDLDDARQEVLMCLHRCLSCYKKEHSQFNTYFHCAFYSLEKRFYYSHFHNTNINMNADNSAMCTDGERVVSNDEADIDRIRSDERFAFVDSMIGNDFNHMIEYLSPQAVEVYNLLLKHMKINAYMVAKELKVTRTVGKNRLDNFKHEMNIIKQEMGIK